MIHRHRILVLITVSAKRMCPDFLFLLCLSTYLLSLECLHPSDPSLTHTCMHAYIHAHTHTSGARRLMKLVTRMRADLNKNNNSTSTSSRGIESGLGDKYSTLFCLSCFIYFSFFFEGKGRKKKKRGAGRKKYLGARTTRKTVIESQRQI